jgi:hypothetical protein
MHFENPSAERVLQPGGHARNPIVLAEAGDFDWQVGRIAGLPEERVAVADQSHDTLHSAPYGVAVEMRDFSIQ